jgi:hypothetical protein
MRHRAQGSATSAPGKGQMHSVSPCRLDRRVLLRVLISATVRVSLPSNSKIDAASLATLSNPVQEIHDHISSCGLGAEGTFMRNQSTVSLHFFDKAGNATAFAHVSKGCFFAAF